MTDDDIPGIGSGPSLLDDDGDDPHEFAKRGGEIAMVAWAFGVIMTILGAALAAYFVWMNAPPVGGEWWPYIRFVAAVAAGVIGAKLGTLTAFVIGALVIVTKATLPSARGWRR